MSGPGSDVDVPAWVRSLGLDGLVDLHVHFLPESVLRKVWAYFDEVLGATSGIIPQIQTLDVLFPVAPILIGVSMLISAITGYVTLRLYVRH